MRSSGLTRQVVAIGCFVLASLSRGGAEEDEAGAAILEPISIGQPLRIEVAPAEFRLSGVRDKLQLIVTGVYEDGRVQDLTRVAEFVTGDAHVALCGSGANSERGAAPDRGVVLPQSDGTTTIVVRAGGKQTAARIEVVGQDEPQPVSFQFDALAALSKQGCNAGACHGSPTGKGGFRMSLRAFDAKLDEYTLTREGYARRINPLAPESSLLLLKPLLKVPHGGGTRLQEQDPAYHVLRDWISEGCRTATKNESRCVGIEIIPGANRTLVRPAHSQQLCVLARFADGSARDVTELAVYSTSDTEVATVTASGLIVGQDRGEAAVIVRYLEFIESTLLTFVKEIDDYRWSEPPVNNYVDTLVHAKLKKLQYLPSELCTDEEFLRRVHLDLTGILPTIEAATRFLEDPSEDKRGKLVDELLERPEYAKFWTLKWGDLLRMTSVQVGGEGVHKYHGWVERAFDSNMPYDEFARRLLTASGSTFNNPPANFYRTTSNMNESVETISQIFLGAKLECAKCHNHPYERWTQDNYYGMGAFFNRVQRKKTGRPDELVIFSALTGDVTQPRTGEKMQPWVPGAGVLKEVNPVDHRISFARWLTTVDNPFFARVEVNRIWSHLLGRGIVEPADDFRESNPPSNAPLLDALARDFAEHGYDRKHIIRTIVNSRTYQMSHLPNDLNRDDMKYFSHYWPRLLSAEQMLDAVCHVTGVPEAFDSLPASMKATQLPAPDIVNHEFLKVFGQPERSTACQCERPTVSNLGMAIQFLNGTLVLSKVGDKDNRFRKLVTAGKSDEEVITSLYLAALSRPPRVDELQAAVTHMSTRQTQLRSDNARIQAEIDRLDLSVADLSKDSKGRNAEIDAKITELKEALLSPDDVRVVGLEDICWVLLNRYEFQFNH